MVENTGFKVLWDFNKQCDRMVEARGLDIIFVHDKQAKEAKIIDITIAHHYPWRCPSKRQRTGENREVLLSWRGNRKVVEVESKIGALHFRSCIRYV